MLFWHAVKHVYLRRVRRWHKAAVVECTCIIIYYLYDGPIVSREGHDSTSTRDEASLWCLRC